MATIITRATRTGDAVGAVETRFSNAISSRASAVYRTRADIAAARRHAAHYAPYNNTRAEAAEIIRIDGGTTYLTAVDLTVDGCFRYCPCDNEATCTA